MRAVDAYELVDPRRVGVEPRHLRLEIRAADLREDLLVREPPLQHGLRRVVERREDQLRRIDERAVEIEEDDGEHRLDPSHRANRRSRR